METRIRLFLRHALVLEKMMIAFFPKRQNPRLACARQGRKSYKISAVPPTFGLIINPQLNSSIYHSATSFDMCADFSVTPLPVTHGIQNTSDKNIITDLSRKLNGRVNLWAMLLTTYEMRNISLS